MANLIRNPSKNYRGNNNYETEDNLGNRQLTAACPTRKTHRSDKNAGVIAIEKVSTCPQKRDVCMVAAAAFASTGLKLCKV